MDRLLVLTRHGQSEWNLKNLFTGWKNPELTEQGISEARNAGKRLKAAGIVPTVYYTSALRRAQPGLVVRWTEEKTDALVRAVEEGALEGALLGVQGMTIGTYVSGPKPDGSLHGAGEVRAVHGVDGLAAAGQKPLAQGRADRPEGDGVQQGHALFGDVIRQPLSRLKLTTQLVLTAAEFGDFFGVELAALEETHDEIFAGAAEHAVD